MRPVSRAASDSGSSRQYEPDAAWSRLCESVLASRQCLRVVVTARCYPQDETALCEYI